MLEAEDVTTPEVVVAVAARKPHPVSRIAHTCRCIVLNDFAQKTLIDGERRQQIYPCVLETKKIPARRTRQGGKQQQSILPIVFAYYITHIHTTVGFFLG